MSQDEFLGERRRALEEAFFAEENQRLLEQLQSKVAREQRREALAEASGLRDEAVLDRIADLGLGPETLAALSLFPLVAVAWADGTVDDRERRAVLDAASEVGVTGGQASYELLDGWLSRRPDPSLYEAWQGYVGALAGELAVEAASALKDDLLGRARRVAESSGGLLGLGNKVSPAEAKVLDELERAFS